MELVSVLELMCDRLWVYAGNEEVINTCCDELTVVTTVAHPDVILSIGGEEFEVSEHISKSFMATKPTALESM
jgi:hypothetical protein